MMLAFTMSVPVIATIAIFSILDIDLKFNPFV